jgi:hypothetical protein
LTDVSEDPQNYNKSKPMKTKLIALLTILVTLPGPVFAGPFRTKLIVGTNTNPDFTLVVPAGRAVTIVNFLCWNVSGDPNTVPFIAVSGDDPTVEAARVLYAASGTDTAAEKDVTINGPAQIFVNVSINQTALLNYKIFAN